MTPEARQDTPSGSRPAPETIASIGEFALIRRIQAVLEDPSSRPSTPRASSDIVLGMGDDAAVVRPEPGWDLAFTCDTQVCGRHFDPRWMGARTIGRRAMTVSLSDIAAMGGEPRYALVALGLPGSMEAAAVEDLYRGMLEAMEGAEIRIVGGNITGCGADWFLDTTLVGQIERGRALSRAGACAGDRILVTGVPGRSAAGLAVLQSITGSELNAGDPALAAIPTAKREIERFLTANPWARSLVRAFRQPQARIGAGRRLAKAADRPASALVDLSDGLIGDLAHICESSHVRARIQVASLPHDPDLEASASHFGRARTAWTLGPSDDYELLFTVRPAASERVANELRAATGLTITEIGEILPPDPSATSPEVGPELVEVAGPPRGEELWGGWDHFRSKT
jgi:thiamine-monophosphate kinase